MEPTAEAAEQAAAGQATKDQPQPEAKPEPYALLSTVSAPIPAWRGVAQVMVPSPDGKGETVETITCTCTWAHSTEEIAAKCARKLIAGRGLKVQTVA